MALDRVQPTWLQAVRICPQLHMQISFAPSILARSELCPCSMPVEKTTAMARASTGASLRSLVMSIKALGGYTRGHPRHSRRRRGFRNRANGEHGLLVCYER